MAEEDSNDEDRKKYKDILRRYAVQYHLSDLQAILAEEDIEDYYSIAVDAVTLFESDMSVCDILLSKPLKFLSIFDTALIEAQQAALDVLPDSHKRNLSVKRRIHARVMSLPVCPELTRVTLPRTSDVGNFLSISGTVIRTTVVKMLEKEREFSCTKCRTTITVQADLEQYFALPRPTHCTNDSCSSTAFSSATEKGGSPLMCQNYQEIKVQEQVQRLAMGTIPRALWVVLEDDLVDSCKAGDDVVISGIVRQRWRNLSTNSRCDIELILQGNHVRVINEQKNNILITDDLRNDVVAFWERHKHRPLTARNEILASLCPQVYGLYVVKLAVAMVLAGGVQRVDESGTKVRGEAHLLLVGDPGTGKSQFLKYAAKITPRSVLTTGIGSTSAGLTVTAVKDSGEWQLEAGALVLADAGVCCIDEFNSIREHDKASIHEAMEQQTISVAKAGLVCKLNTRTTILAAANPKGRYDIEQSLCVNVALASPLLSRFDLVLVLVDSQNEDWDRHVSSYILENKDPRADSASSQGLWSMERMQAYIALIKTISPRLSQDSSRVLQAYYRAQRCADERNAARTSMRLLQSMIRLAQAHARLMFRDEVTIQDAVVAVTVMESSMQGAALLGGQNALHTSFPNDSEAEYAMQAEMILTCLALPDLLEREVERVCQERAAAEQEGGRGEDPRGPAPQYSTGPSTQSADQGCPEARNQHLQELPQRSRADDFHQHDGRGNQNQSQIPDAGSEVQDGVSRTQGRHPEGSRRLEREPASVLENLVGDGGVKDSESDKLAVLGENPSGRGQSGTMDGSQSRGPSVQEDARISSQRSDLPLSRCNQMEEVSPRSPGKDQLLAQETVPLQRSQEPVDAHDGTGNFTRIKESHAELEAKDSQMKPEASDQQAPDKNPRISPSKFQHLRKFTFVSHAKLCPKTVLTREGETEQTVAPSDRQDPLEFNGSKELNTGSQTSPFFNRPNAHSKDGEAEGESSSTVQPNSLLRDKNAIQTTRQPPDLRSHVSHTIQKRLDQKEARTQTKILNESSLERSSFPDCLEDEVDMEAKLVCVKDKSARKSSSSKTTKLVTKLKEKFTAVEGKGLGTSSASNVFLEGDKTESMNLSDDDLFDADTCLGKELVQFSKPKSKGKGQRSAEKKSSPRNRKITKQKRISSSDAVDEHHSKVKHTRNRSDSVEMRRCEKEKLNMETMSNCLTGEELSSDGNGNTSLKVVSVSTLEKLKHFSFGKCSDRTNNSSSNSDSITTPLECPENLPDLKKSKKPIAIQELATSNANRGEREVGASKIHHSRSDEKEHRKHIETGTPGSLSARSTSGQNDGESPMPALNSPLCSLVSEPDLPPCPENLQAPLPCVGSTPSDSQMADLAPPLITSTPFPHLPLRQELPAPSSSPVPKVASQSKPAAPHPEGGRSRSEPVPEWQDDGIVPDSQGSNSDQPVGSASAEGTAWRNRLPPFLQSSSAGQRPTKPSKTNSALLEEEVIPNSQASLSSDCDQSSSSQRDTLIVRSEPTSLVTQRSKLSDQDSGQTRRPGGIASRPSWLAKLNARSSQQSAPFPLQDGDDGLDDLDLELDFGRPVGAKPGRKS